MKKIIFFFVIVSYVTLQAANAQINELDKEKFFEDTSVVNATITTNMVNIDRRRNKEGAVFPASLQITLKDGTRINDSITIETRGHFRKGYCSLPPLKINFKYKKNSYTSPLKDLKLVNRCRGVETGDQYLLKEYLIYKIYNLITDMSFRVRLLHLNFIDNHHKKKPLEEYAFLMENIKWVAKRNDCKERKDDKMDPRKTNRLQMATVAIFEYMIGNTDWAVASGHNTKLIVPKIDSSKSPYVVPYDFDYSGLVGTDYAIPDPKLNISSVYERLYRGFPKTIEEINTVVDKFKSRKDSIYNLINHFDLLSPRSKKEMTAYLDDFFSLLNQPEKVKSTFIYNARTE